MTIDVLLPAKNAEKTLDAAIRSTSLSLGSRGRIILLDDGSTDTTAEIMERWSRTAQNISWIRNEVSGGVAEGLNKLFSLSSASLVARMDADDLCLPWRFRHQARQLRRRGGLIFSSYLRFGAATAIIRQPLPVRLTDNAVRAVLPYENVLCHPTMIATREAFGQMGGYPAISAEDWGAWLQAVTRKVPIHRTGVPVLLYRTSATQVSSSADWRRSALSELRGTEAWRDASRTAQDNEGHFSVAEMLVIKRARRRSHTTAR